MSTPAERNKAWAGLDSDIQDWLIKISDYAEEDAFDAFVSELDRGDYDDWLDLLADAVVERQGGDGASKSPSTDTGALTIGKDYRTPLLGRGKSSGAIVRITSKGTRGVYYCEVVIVGPNDHRSETLGIVMKIPASMVPNMKEHIHHACPGFDGWRTATNTSAHMACTSRNGKPRDIESADVTEQCDFCKRAASTSADLRAAWQLEKDKEDRLAAAIARASDRKAGAPVIETRAALKAPVKSNPIVPAAGRRRVRRGG